MKALLNTDPKNDRIQEISPWKISRAVVALELGASDDSMLAYLDFLSTEVVIGSVYFVHILPKFDLFNTLYERETSALISNYDLNEEITGRMKEKIRRRPIYNNAVHIGYDVRDGNPLEELLRDTDDLDADLVVIGQRGGVSQHGILARNLARKVRRNALIIPEGAKPALRHILVPVDFSPNSVEALHTAVAIRKSCGEKVVRITCLNVYDLPNLRVYQIQKSRSALTKMVEADREAAFQAFLNTHAPEMKASIETVLLEREDPGVDSYINRYAEAHGVDLIVIGARGHSKVELLLLGSVTEKVLTANKNIATLVVK